MWVPLKEAFSIFYMLAWDSLDWGGFQNTHSMESITLVEVEGGFQSR